ncbi:MAG: 2-C-methyl-D-erythritol 4-phosphate cytidylyltransferase [Ignavibacteria bacterium]|nr:MAG: 2-C-methyl-D-erythritol 4-phosphate cytidylyltransferase [Ignavibacteria bacterium]KAF0160384.1 MAG: 2-C-methyl-D-erythritol 4-phosphate cytidylyltransferase [Ignavibacteria bacterium]
MKTYVIIPSGGLGKRINTPLPKQYLQFAGKELIAYTLQVFQSSKHVDEIVVAAQSSFFPLLESIKQNFDLTKFTCLVEGGEERQHSVYNALKSLRADDDDIIVVHDAVRPLLTKEILYNSIQTAKQFGSAVVAMKAKDTLIRGNDFVMDYVDRSEFFYAQTPQVFKYKILMEAMKKSKAENFIGTDESMLVHRAGYKIKIVNGSSLNFKITTDEDIQLLSLILKSY